MMSGITAFFKAVALGTATTLAAREIVRRIPAIDVPLIDDKLSIGQEPVLQKRRRASVTIEDVPTDPNQGPSGTIDPASLSLSASGYRVIQGHEGLRLRAYDDLQPDREITSPTQVIGKLTIGYGHTGTDVFVGQVITKDRALQLLKKDVRWAEDAVRRYVKVPLRQNEYDALVSLTYNIGSGNFLGSSLLRFLNQGERQLAANEFPKWRLSQGRVLAGLERRRADEKRLFQGVA